MDIATALHVLRRLYKAVGRKEQAEKDMKAAHEAGRLQAREHARKCMATAQLEVTKRMEAARQLLGEIPSGDGDTLMPLSDDEIMVFRYHDGDRDYVLDYIGNIFEDIRAGTSDPRYAPEKGHVYTIEIDYMPRAEFDAIPEV